MVKTLVLLCCFASMAFAQTVSQRGNGTSLAATVSLTGQTAAITTSTLCGAGACGAGHYRISASIASSVVCATPNLAVAGLTISWNDGGAKSLKLPLAGGGLSGTDVTVGNTTAFGQGTMVLWSSGASAIQYATNYTACTAGTGTYTIRIAVEGLQ